MSFLSSRFTALFGRQIIWKYFLNSTYQPPPYRYRDGMDLILGLKFILDPA